MNVPKKSSPLKDALAGYSAYYVFSGKYATPKHGSKFKVQS
jgi:hypothetical protein